jgi:superoxide dismutase, Cu-Zn family
MTRIALLALLMAGTSVLPSAAQDASATATLVDQSGATLGTLTLMDMDGGIHISGDLTGVPNGDHGFHIHETGICDASGKFESAGAHFNPLSNQHGTENPQGPHAGDLMNVTADDDGNAAVDLHSAGATIAAGDTGINDADGAAIVLHADPDDYKTDPSGNSGDRFACGVVEFSQ